MSNVKRLVYALVVVALVALPVFAVARAQDKVVVTWWHINTNQPESEFYQAVADEYMAANPNVQIEITVLENEAFKSRLVTVMQAGDPPDIFQSWGGGVLWQYAQAACCGTSRRNWKVNGRTRSAPKLPLNCSDSTANTMVCL